MSFALLNFVFICYAQEVSNDIRILLSSEGKVLYGDEPNSIVVIDYPENIQRIADYLDVIDVPPQQVLIEARLVEVKLQKEHALGVNWKAFADKGYMTLGRFKLGSSALGQQPGLLEQTIPYKNVAGQFLQMGSFSLVSWIIFLFACRLLKLEEYLTVELILGRKFWLQKQQ